MATVDLDKVWEELNKCECREDGHLILKKLKKRELMELGKMVNAHIWDMREPKDYMIDLIINQTNWKQELGWRAFKGNELKCKVQATLIKNDDTEMMVSVFNVSFKKEDIDKGTRIHCEACRKHLESVIFSNKEYEDYRLGYYDIKAD